MKEQTKKTKEKDRIKMEEQKKKKQTERKGADGK